MIGVQNVPGAPIRILFHIVDFGRGGTETALIGWLRALPRDAFHVGLSIAYPTPEFDGLYRSQIPRDIPVHILHAHPWLHRLHERKRAGRLGKLGRLARSVMAASVNKWWSAHRMRQIAPDYDIVIDFDLSLRHLPSRFPQPWIGISHFSLSARLAHRPDKIKRLTRQYAPYAAIGVLNVAMAKEAEQYFGQSVQRIVRLPNAVDLDAIRLCAAMPCPASAMQPGVTLLPWESQRPYVISVARLDEGQKDHATLIAAFTLLVERHAVDIDLVIVGDGPDRAAIEAMARQSGMARRIHFMGFQANPHAMVAAARALVLSSRYEGLGMVLIEAMIVGTPVISTDCPTGPREVLDDGKAGILVPPGDIEALAAALHTLSAETSKQAVGRSAMAARAQTQALGYGPQASTARLKALCLSLLQRDA